MSATLRSQRFAADTAGVVCVRGARGPRQPGEGGSTPPVTAEDRLRDPPLPAGVQPHPMFACSRDVTHAGHRGKAPTPWADPEALSLVIAPTACSPSRRGTTIEVFDCAVSGAAGNRTPDFMTASPPPLPRNMSASMILRDRSLSACGLAAGPCDRTSCLVGPGAGQSHQVCDRILSK